MLEAEATPGL